MELTKQKLGKFIERIERRNTDLTFSADSVRGVSNAKEIRPTKADISSRSFSRFQIVEPAEFVFNRRTTRMGEKIGLGYNDSTESFIVTEDYVVFHVTDETVLLPDYLNIFFRRPEFDRYVRWDSWGSATEFFNWEEMCDVPIAIPPLAIQQKFAAVYNAMLANQRTYERGLKDLNVVIAASIEKFKHTAPRVPVGTLLEEIDIRNSSGAITDVKGININKEFMPSVANLVKTDLKKYKVIRKDQFAANFMHVMRDGRIPIGLYSNNNPCIISPAYPVFRLKSEKALAEYIMLWFSRLETDRYAAFISDSSVRGGLELNRFYEMEIPLPSKEKQQALVNFYNVQNLIQQNITSVGTKLKNLCPILIKGALQEG